MRLARELDGWEGPIEVVIRRYGGRLRPRSTGAEGRHRLCAGEHRPLCRGATGKCSGHGGGVASRPRGRAAADPGQCGGLLRAGRALFPCGKCADDGDNRAGGRRRPCRRRVAARADARQACPMPFFMRCTRSGVDRVLALGGIQGIAALAFGLFGCRRPISSWPGNAYVAEAKRLLFGRVGIDMIAGPTDSMVVADGTADPLVVAWDLIGQAEHGATSPVWLVTDSASLAHEVARLAPLCAAELPEPNRSAASEAWASLGEIILCPPRGDGGGGRPDRARASACASLRSRLVEGPAPGLWLPFSLGRKRPLPSATRPPGRTMSCPREGPRAIRGGLSVHKFLKTVTWQRVEPRALQRLASVTASISRHEGMEGHARTADIRLRKFVNQAL